MAGYVEAYNKTLELVFRVWDRISGGPKRRMQAQIDALEIENRQHQLNGDLEQTRRTRGQLEELRRRFALGDYV